MKTVKRVISVIFLIVIAAVFGYTAETCSRATETIKGEITYAKQEN